MRCSRAILLVILILSIIPNKTSAAAPPRAVSVDSIELIAAQADVIVHARLIARADVSENPTGPPPAFVFQVIEPIKGSPATTLHVPSNLFHFQSLKLSAGSQAIVAYSLDARRDPFRWNIGPLDTPTMSAWTMDLQQLTDAPSILRSFRAAALFQSKPGRWPHGVILRKTHPHLRPPVELYVPIDSRLETVAQRWIASPDANLRMQGVAALAHFRSAPNTQLLKSLLHDPATTPGTDDNDIPIRLYEVRRAALDVLEQWNIAIPSRPTLESPPKFIRLLGHFPWAFAAMVASLLLPPTLHVLIRRYRSRRHLHIERFSFPNYILSTLALGSFTIALAIAFAGIAGRKDGLLLRFHTRETAKTHHVHELAFNGGRCVYERMSRPGDNAGEFEWLLGFAAPASNMYEYDRYGIRYTTAPFWGMPITWPAARRGPSNYILLSVPIAYPLALALFFPALWLLNQLRLHFRRRRCIRRAQCITCGYDLRHSPNRCPECGTRNPHSISGSILSPLIAQ